VSSKEALPPFEVKQRRETFNNPPVLCATAFSVPSLVTAGMSNIMPSSPGMDRDSISRRTLAGPVTLRVETPEEKAEEVTR
jgi:hypothetical protein